VYRIGYLWVQGESIVAEYRFADDNLDRLPDLAAELVRLVFDGNERVETLRCAPLTVPQKLEAPDVKPNALLVGEHRDDAFHDQLLLRDGLVASAANLAVGGITPEPYHAP
jgi:hypothetical protein